MGSFVSSQGTAMIPKKKELPPPPVVPQPSPVCTYPIWKHFYPGSSFVRLAGVFGVSAVVLGAYGAHGRILRSKHRIRCNKKFLILFVNVYMQYDVRTISLVFFFVLLQHYIRRKVEKN